MTTKESALSNNGSTAAATSSASYLNKAGPLVVARFLSACLTVSIPLVLARAMQLGEYGTYKQIFLIWGTLYFVLPFGIAQSLYYFVPRVEEKRPYFGQTLIYLTFAGALAGVALYLLGPAVAGVLNNPGLLDHRAELAVFVACSVGSFPLELSMTSQGKTRQSALTYLVSDGSRALALIIPVLLGFGLSGMMVAMSVHAACRLVATWVIMVGRTKGPIWNGRLFVNQLIYAAPFGAAMLLNIPQQYAHQFAVGAWVGPEMFAIYAAGYFQLPLVDLLYTPTSEVLMVQLGTLEKEGRMREAVGAFREAAAKLAFFFLPLAAFLFAAAPEFIAAVFGARFLGAVPIFRIALIGIPLAVLPMDGVLRARGRTQHIFFSYLVKAAITVPLVFFGVKRFGMIGGIGAWAIAELVGKAVLFVRVPFALSDPAGKRLKYVEVLPWKDFGKAGLAAACAAIAVEVGRFIATRPLSGLPNGFVYRLVPLAIAGITFGLGYFLVLRVIGVNPMGVLANLRRRRAA